MLYIFISSSFLIYDGCKYTNWSTSPTSSLPIWKSLFLVFPVRRILHFLAFHANSLWIVFHFLVLILKVRILEDSIAIPSTKSRSSSTFMKFHDSLFLFLSPMLLSSSPSLSRGGRGSRLSHPCFTPTALPFRVLLNTVNWCMLQ